MRPYLRLALDFMDLETSGYPYGLSIGEFRPNKEDAEIFADNVEVFMNKMINSWNKE